MNKIYKKLWFRIVLILLVVFGILYWLGIIGFWVSDIKGYLKDWSDNRYMQSLEDKSAELERLYKEDIYGGDTPEETLSLFIKALENKDLELASKYYIIEKQDEALETLRNMSNLDFYIKLLNSEKEGYRVVNDYMYNIDFYLDGEQVNVEEFILNQETNKWKILEL
ncbi:hypothetical protein KKC45_02715 [Patescibacteria group bacterium]|nr:hypothetical protein [Patescibacteria group bacterium]